MHRGTAATDLVQGPPSAQFETNEPNMVEIRTKEKVHEKEKHTLFLKKYH